MSVDERVQRVVEDTCDLMQPGNFGIMAHATASSERRVKQRKVQERWTGHFTFGMPDQSVFVTLGVMGIDQPEVEPVDHVLAMINALNYLACELETVLIASGFEIEDEDDGEADDELE